MVRATLSIAAALVGLVGCHRDAAPPASPATPRALVLDGGTLIDLSEHGRNTADITDAVVVIRDGTIEAAGARGTVSIPSDAEVIDTRGAFIVPGLHDVFATVNNQGQANAFLYVGVTSIVGLDEPGGRRGPLFLDASPGPRIHRLDDVTGYDASGLPPDRQTVYDLTTLGRRLTDQELVAEIDRLASSGVEVLLLYYTLDPQQLRLAAAHARERNLATLGELGAATYRDGIDAGVMGFVHTSRYSLDLAPAELRGEVAKAPFGEPRRRFYELLTTVRAGDSTLGAHAAMLAAGSTALVPTLAMNYLEIPGHRNPWDEPAAALLDPSDIHLPADRESGDQVRAANAVRDAFPDGATEALQRLESVYCRAGATYLAGSGTDAFGTMAGISLHIELEMLVDRCLTPRQALAAATTNVAERFGWSRTGRVAAGCDADILVLDADPTAEISNLESIRALIQGGRVLDRAALLED